VNPSLTLCERNVKELIDLGSEISDRGSVVRWERLHAMGAIPDPGSWILDHRISRTILHPES